MEKAWQTLCAVALAAGSFLFGSPDGLLLTLLAFVLMDYATGLLAAVCARRVSSAVGFRGLLRKMLILAMVGMGHLLDTQLLHAQGLLRNAVIGFYLANEGLSILENAGRMGLPLPEKLRTVLDRAGARLAVEPPSVVIACEEGNVKLYESELLYAESFLHDLVLHTTGPDYRIRESISAFADFFRTHRSYLVNLKAVVRIGRTSVLLRGGAEVPLARGKYDAINRAFIDRN